MTNGSNKPTNSDKPMNTLPIRLLLMLLFPAMLSARTIHVSPSGSDAGDGTSGQPYQTLMKALEEASDNDVIELQTGTYQSNELRITQNNLTIRSASGQWAKIVAPVDVEDIGSCIWYREPEVNGGRLERLEIVGGYYYGVKFETNWDFTDDNGVQLQLSQRRGVKGVTIIGCKIHDTGRDCIKLTPGCSDISILSCEIYRSGVGPANNPGNPDPYSHNAEGIDNVNAARMVVRNCYFHDISTTGVYAKGGATDCLIEQNLIVNTGDGGIFLGFDTDLEFFDTIQNPNHYDCLRGIARNNIILNTGAAGIGFWGAKDCQAINNTVITASTNFHAPLFINHNSMYYGEEPEPSVEMPCEGLVVKNNIFVDNTGTGDEDYTAIIRPMGLTGNNSFGNNCYFKTGRAAQFDIAGDAAVDFNQWKAFVKGEAQSLEADPQLNNQHHLTAASPCIDKGDATPGTNNDYDGNPRSSAVDIGADEFGGTTLQTPPEEGTVGTGLNGATSGVNEEQIPAAVRVLRGESGTFLIELPATLRQQTAKVFSLSGQQVASFTAEAGMLTVSLASQPDGVYLLQLAGETVALVKQ